MKLRENVGLNLINISIYKVDCMFCSSSSIGEYSLAYNLLSKLYTTLFWEEDFKAQGKVELLFFS